MNAACRKTLAFAFHQANQEKKKPSGPKIKNLSNVSSRGSTPGMPASRSGQEKSEEHKALNSRTVLEVAVRMQRQWYRSEIETRFRNYLWAIWSRIIFLPMGLLFILWRCTPRLASGQNPTEGLDHAKSAATLTWCGQVENDNTLVYEWTSQYVKAVKGCSWH